MRTGWFNIRLAWLRGSCRGNVLGWFVGRDVTAKRSPARTVYLIVRLFVWVWLKINPPETGDGPLVLVLGSIYQGCVLGTTF